MDWKVSFLGCIGVGLLVPCVACDDGFVQTASDGGVVATGEGGNPNPGGPGLPSYAPAGAVLGETIPAFQTTVSNWANLDATGKVKDVVLTLPVSAVVALTGSPTDSRVWLNVPMETTRDTAIKGLAIDYLAKGHIPKGIYDTPHWEFHIIYQDFAETRAIDCSDETMPPDDLIPMFFVPLPPPDNCFAAMGLHSINVTAPEFNKQRFTVTSLLVYYHGPLATSPIALVRSWEPKATSEILQMRQSFKLDVPVLPAGAVGRTTTLPTTFNADYNAGSDVYVLTLSGFMPAT